MATLAFIAGMARATILHNYFDRWQASAHPWAKIPDWSWQTWLAIWSSALLLIALEGCYQAVRRRTVEYNILVEKINGLNVEVAALEAQKESREQRLSQITEALDQATKKNEKLEAEKANLQRDIEEFREQVNRPPLTAVQRKQLETVQAKLSGYPREDRELLEKMLVHGEIRASRINDFCPQGVPVSVFQKQLARLTQSLLVDVRYEDPDRIWFIKPELKSAIEYCLTASTQGNSPATDS